MSDPVAIAIIAALQVAFVAWLNKQGKERAKVATAEREVVKTVVTDALTQVHESVQGVEHKVENVRREMNGQAAALLAVTGSAQRAEGNLEGRAEMKEEQRKKENGGT